MAYFEFSGVKLTLKTCVHSVNYSQLNWELVVEINGRGCEFSKFDYIWGVLTNLSGWKLSKFH